MLIKIIITGFLVLFSFDGHAISTTRKANKRRLSPKEISLKLYKDKFYFSSMTYALEHLKSVKVVDSKYEKFVDALLKKTGTELISRSKINILKKLRIKTVDLIIGKKYYLSKNYATALRYLQRVPSSHRNYPEAQMIIGAIYDLKGQKGNSLSSFANCAKSARSFEGGSKNDKVERYYQMMRDNCLTDIARLRYSEKSYKSSLKAFYAVPKKSYIWPYLIVEKAWTWYQLENYNRALGLLVTYNAPLMENYFVPESEILKSLSYYKLCLWGDALKVIDRYYATYKPRSQQLRKILKSHLRSGDYFFRLMMKNEQKKSKQKGFMQNLITQISKKAKYNLDYNAFLRANRELKRLKKMKRSAFTNNLIKNLSIDIKVLKRTLNFFVKKYVYNFVNEVNELSYHMFNLKLDILSLQRNLDYKQETLIKDRSRGSSYIDRKPNEMYWDYIGEWWADEFGDYVFALESRCKVVKRSGASLKKVKKGRR